MFPTIVNTLGYNSINTLLLTAPPYVLCTITSLANAWHADRTGERYLHVIWPSVVCMVANIIMATTTSTAPRYFAMMIMIPGLYTGYVVILAWISNSIPRPAAKRAAALGFISGMAQTASVWTSYLYPTTAGPRYITAFSVNCAAAAMVIICSTWMRFILVGLNKKLDAGIYVEGAINSSSNPSNSENPEANVTRGFRFSV